MTNRTREDRITETELVPFVIRDSSTIEKLHLYLTPSSINTLVSAHLSDQAALTLSKCPASQRLAPSTSRGSRY